MGMVGVDISSDTEDTWLALALGEVAGARVNTHPDGVKNLCLAIIWILMFSVIPIALTDEKRRYKLRGLGISSNTVAQPSKEF